MLEIEKPILSFEFLRFRVLKARTMNEMIQWRVYVRN